MPVLKISDGEILELYCENLTNRQIAARLNVTRAAVDYRLQRLGLKNNCHTDDVVDPERVRALHEKGLTNVGIAFVLNTNVLTISRCMKELELPDNYIELKNFLENHPDTEEEINVVMKCPPLTSQKMPMKP
jgi:IS30 family transposase